MSSLAQDPECIFIVLEVWQHDSWIAVPLRIGTRDSPWMGLRVDLDGSYSKILTRRTQITGHVCCEIVNDLWMLSEGTQIVCAS